MAGAAAPSAGGGRWWCEWGFAAALGRTEGEVLFLAAALKGRLGDAAGGARGGEICEDGEGAGDAVNEEDI